MLEKLAAGFLGSAIQSLFGGTATGATNGAKELDEGLFSKLLEKTDSGVTEDGVNSSDSVSTGSADALSLLKEMTNGGLAGYFKWMVKQIREKVMEDMGISEDALAAMPADQKTALMEKIEEEVKKQVAKIMGVDPESAGKMMATADKGLSVTDQMEAKKAYKEDVPTV